MSSPCNRYIDPGGAASLRWPVGSFPASDFPRMDTKQLAANTRAWNFFEQVEAYDANVRLRVTAPVSAGHTTDTSIWYPINTQARLLLYKQGQSLHRYLCPTYSWKSQRDLGISTIPPTSVYPLPAACTPPTSPVEGVGPCPL
jgi:hypothetical protein